jgi:hypothetical protein
MPEQKETKVTVKVLPLPNRQRYLSASSMTRGPERYAEAGEEIEVSSDDANALIGDGRAKKV